MDSPGGSHYSARGRSVSRPGTEDKGKANAAGNRCRAGSTRRRDASRSRRAGKRLSLAGLACLAFLALVIPARWRRPDVRRRTPPTDARRHVRRRALQPPRGDQRRERCTRVTTRSSSRSAAPASHTILLSCRRRSSRSPVTIDATTEDGLRRRRRARASTASACPTNGLWFTVGSGDVDGPGHGAHALAVGIAASRRRTGVRLTSQDNYIGISPERLDRAAEPHRDRLPRRVEPRRRREPDLGQHRGGLRFQDVTGATVRGNRIGTNAAGTAVRGNGSSGLGSGIEIAPTTATGASGIVIGGSGAGRGQPDLREHTKRDRHLSERRTVPSTTPRSRGT